MFCDLLKSNLRKFVLFVHCFSFLSSRCFLFFPKIFCSLFPLLESQISLKAHQEYFFIFFNKLYRRFLTTIYLLLFSANRCFSQFFKNLSKIIFFFSWRLSICSRIFCSPFSSNQRFYSFLLFSLTKRHFSKFS